MLFCNCKAPCACYFNSISNIMNQECNFRSVFTLPKGRILSIKMKNLASAEPKHNLNTFSCFIGHKDL